MKLYIVDYLGATGQDGKPIGHTFGVAKEFYALFEDHFETVYVAPKSYLDETHVQNALELPNCVTFLETELEREKLIEENFKFIRKNCQDGILFFAAFFTEQGYLLPHPDSLRKNVCVCFTHIPSKTPRDGFFKGLLRKIYSRFVSSPLKRMSIIFKTNPNLNFYHKNEIFVPDYFYDKDKLEPYRNIKKDENLVVCLGTNPHPKRQLVEAIEVFKKSKKRLQIIGKFFEDAFYEECKRAAEGHPHITIENRYTSETEYLELLSMAKYSLLPYSHRQHFERTSGVLLDSMFLGTLPIMHKSILDFNAIEGIGYDSINDVSDAVLDAYPYESFLQFSQNAIKNLYSKEFFYDTILRNITELSKGMMQKPCAIKSTS